MAGRSKKRKIHGKKVSHRIKSKQFDKGKMWLVAGISVVIIAILFIALYSPAREALFGKVIEAPSGTQYLGKKPIATDLELKIYDPPTSDTYAPSKVRYASFSVDQKEYTLYHDYTYSSSQSVRICPGNTKFSDCKICNPNIGSTGGCSDVVTITPPFLTKQELSTESLYGVNMPKCFLFDIYEDDFELYANIYECNFGETACGDTKDNDGNGLTDCQDPNCDQLNFIDVIEIDPQTGKEVYILIKCQSGKELSCHDDADNDGDGDLTEGISGVRDGWDVDCSFDQEILEDSQISGTDNYAILLKQYGDPQDDNSWNLHDKSKTAQAVCNKLALTKVGDQPYSCKEIQKGSVLGQWTKYSDAAACGGPFQTYNGVKQSDLFRVVCEPSELVELCADIFPGDEDKDGSLNCFDLDCQQKAHCKDAIIDVGLLDNQNAVLIKQWTPKGKDNSDPNLWYGGNLGAKAGDFCGWGDLDKKCLLVQQLETGSSSWSTIEDVKCETLFNTYSNDLKGLIRVVCGVPIQIPGLFPVVTPSLPAQAEICNDEIDDDNDGSVDCYDLDCAVKTECVGVINADLSGGQTALLIKQNTPADKTNADSSLWYQNNLEVNAESICSAADKVCTAVQSFALFGWANTEGVDCQALFNAYPVTGQTKVPMRVVCMKSTAVTCPSSNWSNVCCTLTDTQFSEFIEAQLDEKTPYNDVQFSEFIEAQLNEDALCE